MPITPDQFETFETLILTEQMSAADAERVLRENPEFADWYHKRADERRQVMTKRENAASPDRVAALSSRDDGEAKTAAGGSTSSDVEACGNSSQASQHHSGDLQPSTSEAPSTTCTDVLKLREALRHALSRFRCLSEDFAAAGDTISQAMCEADAEIMERALSSEPTRSQQE